MFQMSNDPKERRKVASKDYIYSNTTVLIMKLKKRRVKGWSSMKQGEMANYLHWDDFARWLASLNAQRK
jgi:hypothetical protein